MFYLVYQHSISFFKIHPCVYLLLYVQAVDFFPLSVAWARTRKSLLKAYTVNNTTDLCGGLRFSWSEWISLSTLLCGSLLKWKGKWQLLPKTKISHVGFFQTTSVVWYSAGLSPEFNKHIGPLNRSWRTHSLYFCAVTLLKVSLVTYLTRNSETAPVTPSSKMVGGTGCDV